MIISTQLQTVHGRRSKSNSHDGSDKKKTLRNTEKMKSDGHNYQDYFGKNMP